MACALWAGIVFWSSSKKPNAQGKRRRSTEGAEGTNTGQENGEAMASIGVGLTALLGLWRVVEGVENMACVGLGNLAIRVRCRDVIWQL